MRFFVLVALVFGCTSPRVQSTEAPFITCEVGPLTTPEDEWLGTSTFLMAPPATFAPELRGSVVRVFWVDGNHTELDAWDPFGGSHVRDNGGLHIVIIGHDIDLDDHPLHITVGDDDYVINAPPSVLSHLQYTGHPIVEDPEDWMTFAAGMGELELEFGVFANSSTGDMVAVTPPTGSSRDLISTLGGREGHKASVALQFTEGVACISTPCGCSPRSRATGGCRLEPPPSGDPPE